MLTYKSLLAMPDSNAIKPKKSFKVFNGQFPIDEIIKKKVDSLISSNEISTIKEMMKNGCKFVLTKKNIQRLVTKCHDVEFYEILHEKGLLFNINLIEEAIRIDNVKSIETMVQALAGGWKNHKDNGQDFYVKMMVFSMKKNGDYKTNVTKYIYSCGDKVEQLFVNSFVIYQSFVDYKAGSIFYELSRNSSQVKENYLQARYIASWSLEKKIMEQLQIYQLLLIQNCSHIINLKELLIETPNLKDSKIFNEVLSRIGVKVMTLKILSTDLRATAKLERNKWHAILGNNESKKIGFLLLKNFNTPLNSLIKEISQNSELKNDHLIHHPKFSHITRFSLPVRLDCLNNFYFSTNKYYLFDIKQKPCEYEKQRISYCQFIIDNFKNCMMSINFQDPINNDDKSSPKIEFQTKAQVKSYLEKICVEEKYIEFSKVFQSDVQKLSRSQLLDTFVADIFSQQVPLDIHIEKQKIFLHELELEKKLEKENEKMKKKNKNKKKEESANKMKNEMKNKLLELLDINQDNNNNNNYNENQNQQMSIQIEQNNPFEKDEGLDPTIQNEIDEMVLSLIFNHIEYEDEDEPENSNLSPKTN
ncbi:hypothetical protein ACTFIY_010526 [Dictyostelium cf. discoideum]